MEKNTTLGLPLDLPRANTKRPASAKPFLRMRIFTWYRGLSLVLTLKGLILARKPGEYAIISY